MWHGILVDVGFNDPSIADSIKIIGTAQGGNWVLCKIEFQDKDLDKTIKAIQKTMKPNFYSHVYSKKGKVIAIFKEKTFEMSHDKSSWKEAVKYGLSLNIPKEQLDFFPCRFEDETY